MIPGLHYFDILLNWTTKMYHEISHTWKQEIKGDRRLWVVVVGNWRLSPKSPFWDLWSNLVSHQFWWRILPSGKVDNDAKKYSVWFLDSTICSLRTSWRCVYNKYCSDNLAIAIKYEIERISYGWECSEPLPAPPFPFTLMKLFPNTLTTIR